MGQYYIGQIICTSFDFAPRGFALCNGQLMSIQQNPALFAILGTYYGGNGVNNFGLPNLQGRVPTHSGTGTDGTSYFLGEVSGQEGVALLTNQLPAHTHNVVAADVPFTTNVASGSVLSQSPVASFAPTSGSTIGYMDAREVSSVGGNTPHSNMQPFQVISMAICISGIFPTRS